MNTFWKVLTTAAIVLFLVGIGLGSLNAVESNYLSNASFPTLATLLLILTAVVYLAIRGIRSIWTKLPFFAIILFVIQSCNYAKSNQQVLISDDCGIHWKQINAGDAVPKGLSNPCYMRVVVPNFPMQGDARFITNLSGRVRVTTHIDYDYSIYNSLSFIKEAKTLGKTNVDPDSAIDPAAFESAENRVIDKRIRDVAKELFLTQDIIDLDQAELEDKLMELCNKRLDPLGVKLNFVTLTFDTDEQTRQAIDISTAMKIYTSKGLGELGEKVMVARAGATKVTVENKLEKSTEVE